MSGELLALFGVVLAAAVAELMIPAEGRAGTRSFLHFLTALAVLVLMLHPLFSSLSAAEDLFGGELSWGEETVEEPDYEAVFERAVAARSAVQLRAGLQDMLEREYGGAPESCEIGIVLNEAGELQRITVILSGAALLQDPAEIQSALGELLPCVVEVR